jgi:hypothetical protein
MMLQQRIDDVLEGVRLSDLLDDEMVVRARVGLGPSASAQLADAARAGGKRRPSATAPRSAPGAGASGTRRLPVLQD